MAISPCMDNCYTNTCSSAAQVQLEEKHTNDYHYECSPLCNCLCCNTVVTPSYSYSFEPFLVTYEVILSPTVNITLFSSIPASPPPKS